MAKEYANIFLFQGPPKFIKIWIFGLKKKHLATLELSVCQWGCRRTKGI
jgi:hypothetical protein